MVLSMIMKKLIFFSLFFVFISCETNENHRYDIHKNAFLLNSNELISSEYTALELLRQGQFNIRIGERAYHNFDRDKNLWIYIKLPKRIDSLRYFTLWHQFYNHITIYRLEGDTIKKLNEFNRLNAGNEQNLNFRLPTWEIEKGNDLALLIKLNNSITFLTLKFLLLDKNEFLDFNKKDSMITSVLATFLFVLLIVDSLLFLTDKEQGYFWYGLFILFSILDLFMYKGVLVNHLLEESLFFTIYFKTLVQLFGISFLILFQLYFYGRDRISLLIRKVLRTILTVNLGLIILFVILYLGFPISNIKSITWLVLMVELSILILIHVSLAIQKKIPVYLVIAFILPLFVYQSRGLYNPKVNISIEFGLLLDSAQYIATSFELLVITYFIISEILEKKNMVDTLKQENLKLLYSFESRTTTIQQQERNKLLNNVHDSFGGYLEALKLQFSSKSQKSSEKVDKIIESFYKEYRYLLNRLYSPKINSENLIFNLAEYCEKINEITDKKIHFHFSLKNIQLSQNKCLFIYNCIAELITNTIKHSQATIVDIIVSKENHEYIIIEVSDDGIGFNNNVKKINSFGLINLEEQIVNMKGEMSIRSNKDQGTKITIKIPEIG